MPVSVETRGGETAVFLSGEVDHHGARAMSAVELELISGVFFAMSRVIYELHQ